MMTRRGMRTGVVVCAVVVGLAACSGGGSNRGGAGSTTTTLPGDDVRINQIQVLGSHNSYHRRPPAALLSSLQRDAPAIALEMDYAHAPLVTQLSKYGLRQLEIDAWFDPKGGRYAKRPALANIGLSADGPAALREPGFKVFHDNELDFESSCLTLEVCLTQIEQWSKANPSHVPVMVLVELKEESLEQEAAARGTPVPKGAIPRAITTEVLDKLDAEIRSVVPPADMITPDDVRGTHATLAEAVRTDGWPALGHSRGKLLFTLDNEGIVRALYRKPSAVLAGRVMFTSSSSGAPDAAFIKVNDITPTGPSIRSLVTAGYLVRTRADDSPLDARTNNTVRRDRALGSGAQYVSTDYYVADPAMNARYVVALPGNKTVRCDPVNAPPNCPPNLEP